MSEAHSAPTHSVNDKGRYRLKALRARTDRLSTRESESPQTSRRDDDLQNMRIRGMLGLKLKTFRADSCGH